MSFSCPVGSIADGGCNTRRELSGWRTGIP
jgi:hypothetical protein